MVGLKGAQWGGGRVTSTQKFLVEREIAGIY